MWKTNARNNCKVNKHVIFILDCNCKGEMFSGTCNDKSGVCDCKENYRPPNCTGKSICPGFVP